MYVKNQKFLILGVSKSGLAAAKFLLDSGATCFFYEEMNSEKISAAKREITSLGGREITAETVDSALEQTNALIISPGVPINHAVAVSAKAKGVRIIGELELGFISFTPPFIAVTGTNGKTTTVSLIDGILKKAGIDSRLVGNIGVPLTSEISGVGKDTVFVTEVSSFQLESVNAFCPHISCVLNISPDHLERHYSMENYIFLKKRIFFNQRESEYCVLNFDDRVVKGFYTEIKAKVLWVSVKEEVDGAYKKDGALYFKGEKLIDCEELPISGEHNEYNVLFAIAVAGIIGIDFNFISCALKEFKGVPFRNQFVAEKNGVIFVNDSKSTNTASAITAIRACREPVVLILGGSEKGESYDELFENIKNSTVKHVVLTGRSRRNMLISADKVGYQDITVCSDFDCAVKVAAMMAGNGDKVLLSPACASFDAFSSYAERGERFNKIVGELI
ncbi:MAG: UDP-N-acetylmuramoyl-L-alanine--D-glutamate ligase [Clostridia bacterium]|nr:UDP-N-acetylmuramoyl-L-alanine--D-glutamate ligase [Clostridia bacterium]